MLYKFKSRAAGDLIMLEPDGRHMLEIIGKTPGPRGIILVAEMLPAVAALHDAIAKYEAEHQALVTAAGGPAYAPPPSDAVTLRQRAVPFIQMLKECAQAQKDIVWGV
ncbi:MAG TPA: DUF1840 domain-containing protein [Rhodoferax sp.]|jgi:hypothetical protein|nr:DUF1840 domain-containing protein [Rhodoferax sp.]